MTHKVISCRFGKTILRKKVSAAIEARRFWKSSSTEKSEISLKIGAIWLYDSRKIIE